MKPAAFDYLAVRTPQEAVSALAENPGETRILAGGQSLVLDMNYRRERPAGRHQRRRRTRSTRRE